MRLPSFLVIVSIVSLAAALTDFDSDSSDCGVAMFIKFNGTRADRFVRCAETTYYCNRTPDGVNLFLINSTNEAVPADCKKVIYDLQPTLFSGPLAMPGLTELAYFTVSGLKRLGPAKITSIDLPDLVNITKKFSIDYADSISSLSVPKLKHISSILKLNFTGGPAMDLSFPSLSDVGDGIYLHGEIDSLDFPALNNTITVEGVDRREYSNYSISIHSTGNLDCNAFAASVVNSTSYDSNGVSCTSKKGSVTLKPPKPEVTSAALRIRGDFLALTALLAYILAL
ncbi:hypothetical protein V493_01056 [Pseudogymnoascus sp. VKM F-4281 (FW-2241)]|nr:hypothetical protein V493_01056 [Pseudogymnoascus sp. VKM F-4281 (FW-2241)]